MQIRDNWLALALPYQSSLVNHSFTMVSSLVMQTLSALIRLCRARAICHLFACRVNKFIFFLAPILSFGDALQSSSFEERLSFHSLMEMNRYGVEKFLSKQDLAELEFYRNCYEKNEERLFSPSIEEERKISKIIHFIWLGPKKIPSQSLVNFKSWKEHHPDWIINFWTDNKERDPPFSWMKQRLIQELDLRLINAFLDKTENWAEKSDLLRSLILFEQGGIYSDHDVFCLQSFDNISARFDFLVVLEPPHYLPAISNAIYPNNGLICSKAGHPILKKAMEKAIFSWDKIEKMYPGEKMTYPRVIARTFKSFAEAVREGLSISSERDIVLPAFFLFPSKSNLESKKREKERYLLASHEFGGFWADPKR